MLEQPTIISETKGAIRYLTLNRPGKRNALDNQMVEELRRALTAAEADAETRVIVLRGAGKDFCAGMDLSRLETLSSASILENRDDAAQLGSLFTTIRELRKPVIAGVHGRAVAGGAGLALACDLVIAGRSAYFGFTEVAIGFVPAMVMAVARRNMSEKRAFEILATGKMLTSEEAERIGLINSVCDDDQHEAEVERQAGAVAKLSQSAVMLTKYLLYQTDSLPFERALKAGVDINTIARLTPDTRSGVKNFLKKK
jgi:methylglutaconyl-CoA hydratase